MGVRPPRVMLSVRRPNLRTCGSSTVRARRYWRSSSTPTRRAVWRRASGDLLAQHPALLHLDLRAVRLSGRDSGGGQTTWSRPACAPLASGFVHAQLQSAPVRAVQPGSRRYSSREKSLPTWVSSW